MPPATPDPLSRRAPSVDRAVGVVLAAAHLASAVLVARGLADLMGPTRSRALVLLVLAVGVRAIGVLFAEENTTAEQRSARAHAHRRSAGALARSRPEDLHDLDTAIDHLGAQPALDVLAGSAVAGLAGILIVALLGGWLAGLIVVVLLLASLPAYVNLGRASEALREGFNRRRSALLARQLAVLRSITDLRALGAVDFAADEIAAASSAEHRVVIDGVRTTIRSSLVTEFLGGVSVGLVAMDVGLRLWHHSISLYPALAAVLITAEVVAGLRRYGAEFHRRDDARTAAERLAPLYATHAPQPAEGDLLSLVALDAGAPCGPVTLRIGPGERVQLVGPSGVGKTTTVRAALGLAPAAGGRAHRAARRVGLVSPHCHFLAGSVRENLDLGAGCADAALEDVLESVGLARRLDLDEPLAEDARSLSSGERVQLAVARALVADVDLLILDDVAGLLDHDARRRLAGCLEGRTGLAVLEATTATSVLSRVDRVTELRS